MSAGHVDGRWQLAVTRIITRTGLMKPYFSSMPLQVSGSPVAGLPLPEEWGHNVLPVTLILQTYHKKSKHLLTVNNLCQLADLLTRTLDRVDERAHILHLMLTSTPLAFSNTAALLLFG